MKLAVRLDASRRAYVKNVLAHLGGLYGAKGFELIILGAVSRAASLAEIGAVFYAVAFGNALFQLTDLGLYPVLFRRAAREQVGPSLLARATIARVLGVLVLVVPFAFIVRVKFPERTHVAMVFFVLAGAHIVHEVPRAVLAGRERFMLLASASLVTKALETVCTMAGLFFGLGIWAWALGRAVQNATMFVASYALAHRDVRAFPSPTTKEALKEGLPFWFATGIGSTLSQVDTLVVGTYLGLAETARLGIAGRAVGGALGVVGSMMNVAFPDIARKNRRFPSAVQVRTVLATAFLLTLPVLFGAPLIVRVVTGRFDPQAAVIVRALAPIVAFTVFDRALTTWLQAKNKERSLALVTTASSFLSALALIVLIPAFRTSGAAYSRVFREAVTSVGLLLLALMTARRVASPLAWAVAKIPGMPALVRARLEATTSSVASRIADDPRVLGVEVSGSGGRPDAFEPGRSDLDFIVTTRTAGAELDAVLRHCGAVVSRVRFTGAAHVQLVHADVLVWARRAGHPVLTGQRLLRGQPHEERPDPTSARAWALTHAASIAIRMQGYALEDARRDGGTRSDRVSKEFRFLLHRLGSGNVEEALGDVRARGYDLPDSLIRAHSPPRWLSPETTADLFRATHELLSAAFAGASSSWGSPEPSSRSAPPWLARLADAPATRRRVFPPAPVQLTPTGPTEDDPMLVVAPAVWSREEWLSFLVETAAIGRLGAPFRAYRWPVVLPESTLVGDCLVEHAALFHLARRRGAIDLVGAAAPGRVPPPDVLRAAAMRETLQALIRITADRTRVARVPVWRRDELREPVSIVDAWPFRVRAMLEGRLASLSLIVDHGIALPDRESVTAGYLARYDDPLCDYLRAAPAETAGTRVAEVLDAWAAARIELLSRLHDDSSRL